MQRLPLVTLVGPGGIGKTVLALETARQLFTGFQTDVWLIELASLKDPGHVQSAVKATLRLALDSAEITPMAIAQAIGGKKQILVIDNCEHCIDSVAELAETIVKYCPGTTILATSREALRIDGEGVYRVRQLDVPPQGRLTSDVLASRCSLFMSRTDTRLGIPAAGE
jgi:predicted ATPase